MLFCYIGKFSELAYITKAVIDFDDGMYHWYALDIEQVFDSLEEELNVEMLQLAKAEFVVVCLCLLITTVINYFTGFINPAIQVGRSGSVICALGFIMAVIWSIEIEEKRLKKDKHGRSTGL